MCLWPAGRRGSLRAAEKQSSDFILRYFILIQCIRWNGPTCRGDGPVGAAGKMFQRGREHVLGHLGDERCAQAHGEARQHRALRQVSVAVCEWIPSDAWGRSGQGRAGLDAGVPSSMTRNMRTTSSSLLSHCASNESRNRSATEFPSREICAFSVLGAPAAEAEGAEE